MKRDDIIKVLIQNGYDAPAAEVVSNEIVLLSEELVPLYKEWANEKAELDYNVEGLSLLELKDAFNMTYPAALLTIDWLIKEPEVAIKAILLGSK